MYVFNMFNSGNIPPTAVTVSGINGGSDTVYTCVSSSGRSSQRSVTHLNYIPKYLPIENYLPKYLPIENYLPKYMYRSL